MVRTQITDIAEANYMGNAPRSALAYLSVDEYERGLRQTYFGHGSLSSRTHPQTMPLPDPGTWRIDSLSLRDGRLIEELLWVSPDLLEVSEDTGLEKWADVERYAEWNLQGLTAPPISVVQTVSGRLKVSNGHRRNLAAKATGHLVLAWVSWTVSNEEGLGVGLTYELALNGAKPHLDPLPPRPEFQTFAYDLNRLKELRKRLAISDEAQTLTPFPV